MRGLAVAGLQECSAEHQASGHVIVIGDDGARVAVIAGGQSIRVNLNPVGFIVVRGANLNACGRCCGHSAPGIGPYHTRNPVAECYFGLGPTFGGCSLDGDVVVVGCRGAGNSTKGNQESAFMGFPALFFSIKPKVVCEF